MRGILAFAVIFLLLFGLFGSAFASYQGMGLVGNRTYSLRQGSSNGIFIMGGGPGSGK